MLCVIFQFTAVQVLAGHEQWIRGLSLTIDGKLERSMSNVKLVIPL
jgi:hypothetical protein